MNAQSATAHRKLEHLTDALRGYGKVAVAFSGGVDSTFLLAVAKNVLGENAVPLFAKTPFVSSGDKSTLRRIAEELDAVPIEVEVDLLLDDKVVSNPEDRCYFCKSNIFRSLGNVASDMGIGVLADGSNTDDLAEYRPGERALSELGVVSPLRNAGLTKKEIRLLSKEMGLSVHDAPSNTCLATRIPTGQHITSGQLHKVDAAEAALHELGFAQSRVRAHEDIARIEVAPELFEKLMEDSVRIRTIQAVKAAGFDYVTLDMEGYRLSGNQHAK